MPGMNYTAPVEYPVSVLSPGIMGPYRFTTYTKARITRIDYDGQRLAVHIRGGKGQEGRELVFEAVKRRFGSLKAPNHGAMSRTIKESVDSDLTVRLAGPGGSVVFEDTGSRAGLEVIEEIFEYLPGHLLDQ